MTATRTNIPLLDNESGFVLVLSLLVLLVLVVLGISATKDSQIDLLIAGNDKLAKQNFYLAEGVVAQAAQTLANTAITTPDILKARTLGGLRLYTNVPDLTDMKNPLNWAAGVAQPGWSPGVSYLIVDKGIADGETEDMTASQQMHRFDISGRSVDNAGNTTIISIGYRISF